MDKITLKFHDKERELDLSNADDQSKLKELAEKGYAYEEGQTKLKGVEGEREKLQTVLDRWNGHIESAKANPEAKDEFIKLLQLQGLDLTAKEKEDVGFIEDKAQEKLDKLASELAELRKDNNQLQTYVLGQHYDTEHAQLESEYTKDNGYPAYDREAVQEYADKNGIVSFKTAYIEMNQADIIKAQSEFQTKKQTLHQEKIDRVSTTDPDKGKAPDPKPKVHSKYSDASKEWAQDVAAGRTESLFVNNQG